MVSNCASRSRLKINRELIEFMALFQASSLILISKSLFHADLVFSIVTVVRELSILKHSEWKRLLFLFFNRNSYNLYEDGLYAILGKQHGGSVVSSVPSEQEGPGDYSGWGKAFLWVCMFLPVFRWVFSGCSGFPHQPKHVCQVYLQSVLLTMALSPLLFRDGLNAENKFHWALYVWPIKHLRLYLYYAFLCQSQKMKQLLLAQMLMLFMSVHWHKF